MARPRQDGAALLLLLAVVGMGAASLLMSGMAKTDMHAGPERRSAAALAQAREALIGFALANGRLGRRRAFPVRNRANDTHQCHVRAPGFWREAGHVVAEVGRVELRVLVDLAGQEPGAERAERHEPYAQLLQRRQQLDLRAAPEQRILALHRGDGQHRVGAANGLHACFRQAEMLHLACGDQLLDRASDILDRHVGIDAVLIEQVDPVGTKAPEAGVRDRLDVLRAAVRAAGAGAGLQVDIEAELGRDHHLVADRRERLPDQVLVGERTVGFGGVEQGDALLMRHSYELDHLLLVGRRPIGGGHAHATKAESRDFQLVPESTCLHHLFHPSRFI